MKKVRAPDLTPDHLGLVLETLDGWKEKLTWELLVDAMEKATGNRYSRFTYARYPEIANAYALKKESLRDALPRSAGEPRDARVRAALDRAERARARADRLQAENMLLTEQFVTWAINAERRGVTIDMLSAPLPKPERDRSKGVK